MKYYQISEVSTIQQAVESKSPSLVDIKLQNNGDSIAKAFLVVAVTDLVQSFNVGKNMDARQIAFLVQSILKDYYYLKLDELKLCFDNIKKGRYGKVFDRLDAAVIYEFIEVFLVERLNYIQDKRNSEELSNLDNFKSVHPKVLEVLQKVAEESKELPEVKETVKREYSEQELLEQGYLLEFDLEHKKKPYDSKEVVRTITYKGQKLTQSEYLKVRIGGR